MSELIHTPVLAAESVEQLINNRSGVYFDATVGFGGHSSLFLSALDQDGVLIGTDVNDSAFDYSQNKFGSDNRFRLYKYNFSKIDLIAKIESIQFFDGIFADLGVSSFQLDNVEEGFTFRQNALLDLRMDKSLNVSAADVVNSLSEQEIADILYKFGKEKNSRKISRLIGERRNRNRITHTNDLVEIVSSVTPPNFVTKSLMRVFQALRIYVNNELEVLGDFLKKSVSLLKPGGRIVVLTYHSLEDRIVKENFKEESVSCVCPKDFPVCVCGKVSRLKILTKKPLLPTDFEIDSNPRARSAKLRAAVRV